MTRRELAQAIRAAMRKPGMIEYRWTYIQITFGHCRVDALGAALVSHYNGDCVRARDEFARQKGFSFRTGHSIIAKMLGIPKELAREISRREMKGQSIEQIATWLEYSENKEDNANV